MKNTSLLQFLCICRGDGIAPACRFYLLFLLRLYQEHYQHLGYDHTHEHAQRID